MQKWNYNKSADITLGEKRVSKVPYLLLFFLLFLILGTSAIIYAYRFYIYDAIVRPEILLLHKEVEVGLNSDFNPEDYIYRIPDGDRYKAELPEKLDTSKIQETELEYKLHLESGQINITKLKVIIKDKDAPTIKLKEKDISLYRDEEFTCESYLDSVTDNYDKDLQVTCLSNIDKSLDEQEIQYYVKDSSGNEATEVLILYLKDRPVETPRPIARPTRNDRPQSSYNGDNQPSYTENHYTEPATPIYNPTPQPAQPQQPPSRPQNSGPRISGVHDVTVSIGTSIGDVFGQLYNGVSSTGELSLDAKSVNLSSPGSYTVYFSSSDGASATARVHVR